MLAILQVFERLSREMDNFYHNINALLPPLISLETKIRERTALPDDLAKKLLFLLGFHLFFVGFHDGLGQVRWNDIVAFHLHGEVPTTAGD